MREAIIQFKKIFTSGGFYLCVLSTLILLFCAEVYAEPLTGNCYSAIRALLEFNREEMLQKLELCDILVMRSARGGWFTLFSPMIAAFCFVPSMCAERGNNALRFQIVRSSKLKFSLSQYFSGIISGGIAVALGYALFCGMVFFLFPGKSDFGDLYAQRLESIVFDLPKAMLGIWLYGAFWSVPAMFCTSVMQNKYLIMCIPFFIKYGISQTVQRLTQLAFADFENINYTLSRITFIANPDALMYLGDTPDYGWILLNFGIFFALFSGCFLIIQRNRRDCGA